MTSLGRVVWYIKSFVSLENDIVNKGESNILCTIVCRFVILTPFFRSPGVKAVIKLNGPPSWS